MLIARAISIASGNTLLHRPVAQLALPLHSTTQTTMAIADADLFPHATGEAAKTVAKHTEPQELVFYAGWVCSSLPLRFHIFERLTAHLNSRSSAHMFSVAGSLWRKKGSRTNTKRSTLTTRRSTSLVSHMSTSPHRHPVGRSVTCDLHPCSH